MRHSHGRVHIIDRAWPGSEIREHAGDGRRCAKETFGANAHEIIRHVEVAKIGAELQIIVETMLERVAERKLFQLVAIGAGLAEVAAVGNTPEWTRQ